MIGCLRAACRMYMICSSKEQVAMCVSTSVVSTPVTDAKLCNSLHLLSASTEHEFDLQLKFNRAYLKFIIYLVYAPIVFPVQQHD